MKKEDIERFTKAESEINNLKDQLYNLNENKKEDIERLAKAESEIINFKNQLYNLTQNKKEEIKELKEQIQSTDNKTVELKRIKNIAIGIIAVIAGLNIYNLFLLNTSTIIKNKKDINEHVKNKKAELSKFIKEKEGHTFYLSHSRTWMNTGIRVKKGEVYNLYISGSIHSALNTIFYNHVENKKLDYPWTHYPSNRINNPSDQRNRKEKLIWKNGYYRDIVLAVIENDIELKNLVDNPGYLNENFEKYESKVEKFYPNNYSWSKPYMYKAKFTGTLCFVINDNYLNKLEFYTSIKKVADNKIDDFKKIEKLINNNFFYNKNEDLKFSAKNLSGYMFRHHFNPPDTVPDLNDWEKNNYDNTNEFKRLFFDDNLGGVLITIRKK